MRRIFLTFSIILALAAIIFVTVSSFLAKDPTVSNDTILQVTSGLSIFLPKENTTVSSPLKISGIVNGDGWTGFEGQVGIVKLFDDQENQLALGILTATSDWMHLPTNFETTLWFDYPGDGQGKLVFKNENASGDPERDKSFELPVKLSKSSSEKTTVKAYFLNSQQDPEVSCDKVFPVTRDVPKTTAVAMAALKELIKGPTNQEKIAGFSTGINVGTKVQGLTIENGVAKVDFNDVLDKNVAGSCNVIAIRTEIEETLKQFSSVNSVVISINGNSEDILQP